MKKKKIVFEVIILVLLFVLGALSYAFIVNEYTYVHVQKIISETPLQSQCYTNLQPSIYFNAGRSPITQNTDARYLQLTFDTSNFTYNIVSNTGSMRPTIPDYANVLEVAPKNPSELHVGDIIVFTCDCKNIMHRIINIDNGFYITKGDNNNIDDKNGLNCSTQFKDIQYKIVGVLY